MFYFLTHHTPLLYLTQSIWRDEAFSILLSERSPLSFLTITFEPPVYYLLLHFWMKLFGNNEIVVRCLSLFGFTIATIVIIYWAEKLFKKHWLSWYVPVFFFINPTLIYYAFEIRTYGWYICFAVLSMYAYMEKRWKLYILSTILGLFTHTYMVIIPAVQVLHYLFVENNIHRIKRFRTLIRDPMAKSTAIIALIVSPWLIRVLADMGKLKSSWYFPVDFHLIKSVLGNIFLGYEGTPWFLWNFTMIVSIIILIASFVSIRQKSTRKRNMFFLLQMYVPLIIIIGISFIKPLFVNRYVIPATIAEVFMLVFALENIRNTKLQKICAAIALTFVFGFNIWYPSQHQKLDIRSSVQEVNNLMQKNDVILADSPLIFFESIYYSKDRSKVYLYNPAGYPFPWYVGGVIVNQSQIIRELPPYPIRAFIIHENGTFEITYNTDIIVKKSAKLP
jgi:mannosyltransferase